MKTVKTNYYCMKVNALAFLIFILFCQSLYATTKPVFQITSSTNSVSLSQTGSASISFTVRNVSGITLTIDKILNAGYDSNILKASTTSNNCLDRLNNNQTCNVTSRLNAKGVNGETSFEIQACAFSGTLCSGMKKLITVRTGGATISVSPSSLDFLSNGQSGEIVVNNVSTLASPTSLSGIRATLPDSLSDIKQDASDCDFVSAGSSCVLRLTSNQRHNKTSFTIKGDSTNTVTLNTKIGTPWMANGTVLATAVDEKNQLLYFGGNFTELRRRVGDGVPVDASGNPLSTFPEVFGTVRAAISDNQGGWFIGGSFTRVQGKSRNFLAHILSTGFLDTNWQPTEATGAVFALAFDTNRNIIYAGGSNLIGIDATTGKSTGFNITADNIVRALLFNPNNNTLYVGGSFQNIDGQARNRLAAFNSAGNLTNWNPDASSHVWSLALDSQTNIVYASGDFGTLSGPGGGVRTRLGAINADGTITAFAPVADATVAVITFNEQDNILYAGGHFNSFNGGGDVRNGLAAIRTNGTLTAWNPNANAPVRAFHYDEETRNLYVGGDFTTVGGISRGKVAAITTNGTLTDFNPSLQGNTIRAIPMDRDSKHFYLGGQFDTIGNTKARTNLAAMDLKTGNITSFKADCDLIVRSLLIDSKKDLMYVGGNFTTIGGVNRNELAAINLKNGGITSFNPNANGDVMTLQLNQSGTRLYAGGVFTTIGGAARNRIAALNTSTGLATGFNPNADGTVRALLLDETNSLLYTGGEFNNVGGAARNFIAALNTDNSNATAFNANADGFVRALALNQKGNMLYVGGDFNNIGGSARARFAALRAANGTANSLTANANGDVYALSFDEGERYLYIGGRYTTLQGTTRNRLGAIDLSNGNLTNFNPDAGNDVYSLNYNATRHALFAGGFFDTIDFLYSSRLAILFPDDEN